MPHIEGHEEDNNLTYDFDFDLSNLSNFGYDPLSADMGGGFDFQPEDFYGGETTLAEGLGVGGINYEDMQDMDSRQIFNYLKGKGLIDMDEEFNTAYAKKIARIPRLNEVSEDDLGYAQIGIRQDAYGLERDIGRAQRDIDTTQSRLRMDLGEVGQGARSDIYGIQMQGAQQRRQGMFGRGLGGGMDRTRASDISSSMQQRGASRVQQADATARGLSQSAQDRVTSLQRGITDATTDLYGIGGTSMDSLGEGGIYGTYGSMGQAEYNLQQQAIDNWEAATSSWLLDIIDE
tara:strand:+ start:2258 stop:3127 length:870 start_codon:yes stop_codon:yes gene_type:complete